MISPATDAMTNAAPTGASGVIIITEPTAPSRATDPPTVSPSLNLLEASRPPTIAPVIGRTRLVATRATGPDETDAKYLPIRDIRTWCAALL
jgi:hypothetical protein